MAQRRFPNNPHNKNPFCNHTSPREYANIMRSKTTADWDELFRTLQAADPYDKERSIHNCVRYYNHSQPWISHISLQGHDVSQLAMAKKQWWPSRDGQGRSIRKPIVW